MTDASESSGIERDVIAGDTNALANLFQQHHDRLRKMVELRMDRRVQQRVNASDVLQQAFIDLADQLTNYQEGSGVPLFVWMRRITGQRLAKVHREHLGTRKRSAALEVSLQHGPSPQATSAALASQLVGNFTGPQDKAIRAERQVRLQDVLNNMDPEDREVIALRSFEQLSPAEVAAELGITTAAARMRYIRALRKLREELQQESDTLGEDSIIFGDPAGDE